MSARRLAPMLMLALLAAATPAVAAAPSQVHDSAIGHAGRTVLLISDDTSVRAPRSVQAGTMTVTLVNRGHEVHIGSLLRLSGGKTLADFRAVLRHPPHAAPPWIHNVPFGSFSPLSPEHRAGIVADFEATGTYIYFCLLTTPSGQQHALAGELTSFRVVAPETPEQSVRADANFVATDGAFQLPVLTQGPHVLRLHNQGTAPHEFAILQLHPGATLKQTDAWLQGGQPGPAPATFFGGVQRVDPGHSALLNIRLARGRYLVGDGETGVFGHLTVRAHG